MCDVIYKSEWGAIIKYPVTFESHYIRESWSVVPQSKIMTSMGILISEGTLNTTKYGPYSL